MKPEDRMNTDLCVCCGRPVPEGRMVCYICETGSGAIAPCKPGSSPENTGKTLLPKVKRVK